MYASPAATLARTRPKDKAACRPVSTGWSCAARSKPLIAAVNGAAVGIGMTMILPFDVIIASDKARFGMLFIKVGLVPELATHALPRAADGVRARQRDVPVRAGCGRRPRRWPAASSSASCRPTSSSTEAVALGGHDRRQPRTAAADDQAVAHAPTRCDGDLHEVQERESALLRECWTTPEHAEAVAAFMEKRPPHFPARTSPVA